MTSTQHQHLAPNPPADSTALSQLSAALSRQGTDSKEFGQQGEELAAVLLADEGMRVIDRNYRTRYGEIDLICLEDSAEGEQALVFVEVKARRSCRFGSPADAVTPGKRHRVHLAAQAWLRDTARRKQLQVASSSSLAYFDKVRFDVVTISVLGERIDAAHLREAF